MKTTTTLFIAIILFSLDSAAQLCTQATQATGGNCGSVVGTTAVDDDVITGAATFTYIKDVKSFNSYTVNAGAELVICNGGKLNVGTLTLNGGAVYIHSGGSLTISNLKGTSRKVTNLGTWTCTGQINTVAGDNFYNAGIAYLGKLVMEGPGSFFTNASGAIVSFTGHDLQIKVGNFVNNGQMLDIHNTTIQNSGGICLGNGAVIKQGKFDNRVANSVSVTSGTAGLITKTVSNSQQVTNTGNTLQVAIASGCGNNWGTADTFCNTTTLPLFPVSSLVFYSKSVGSLHALSTWGDELDGSGTAPLNFTTDSKMYFITNRSTADITSNWTVGGKGVVLSVGDDNFPVRFTINSANFNFNGSQMVVTANSSVSVAATRTVAFGSGASLWVTSTEVGDGSIGVVNGSVTGLDSGNLIVERYIPDFGTRVWTFLASPVEAGRIGSNWQQQIHITGPASTGGAACTTADSTLQVTANTNNGLDPNPSGNYSMYYLDPSVPPNTTGQWKPVTNTISTSIPEFKLTRGNGFRILVRGPRDLGCYMVGTQATSFAPARRAVTLRSFGSIPDVTNGANFTLPYATSNGNLYILFGNPFISTMSFAAFRATNSSILNNKFWLYSPEFAPGAYSAYASGVLTNRPSNYAGNGSQDTLLGAWQAFILELTTAGSGSLTCQQAHKFTTSPFVGSFKTTGGSFPDVLYLGMKHIDGSPLDEVAIRYVNDPDVTNTNYSSYDAISMSGSAWQFVQTIKDTMKLSIQGRVTPFTSDTVALNVGSYLTSPFQFQATGVGSFTNTDIFLLDRFTGITQKLNDDSDYTFTIDHANTATYGATRFAVVFSKQPIAVIDRGDTRYAAYPSPVSDWLNLELPGLNDEYRISMTNVTGHVVYSANVRSGMNKMDVRALATGTYLLKITDVKGNTTVLKIAKFN